MGRLERIGDRLGCWNLTIKGHAECIDYVKGFGVPLMLLGGGGYTPRNVARCWAWETGVALGKTDNLDDELPFNDYYEFFKPEGYKLHLPPQKNRCESILFGCCMLPFQSCTIVYQVSYSLLLFALLHHLSS